MIRFKKLSGLRIIIFCWDNPLIEGYYLNLLNEIAKYVEIFPMVIATSFLSKLRLIKDGIHAFTYQELINFSLESHSTKQDISRRFSKEILEDLSNYDMRVGWKWIPQQNLSEEEFYSYQSSIILQAYDFIWKQFKPNLAMTWNGVTLFQKTLSFLGHAHNVPVLFLERGLLPQTLYIDSEGVNYKSSLAGDRWFKSKVPYPNKTKVAKAKDYCQRLREAKRSIVNIGEGTKPKELRKKLKIDDSCKIILFPLQIEKDSNILYYSPHYSSMTEIIKDIQQVIAKFQDIILIVKPHPEDINRIDELKSLINDNTYVLEGVNLYSLLELADLVITANSTVGLEALIFHKPVIVLGKAIYSEKGFTYDLLNRQDLASLIEIAFRKHIFNEEEFYRFLVHIFEHKLFHLIPIQDYWKSRNVIATKVVKLMKNKKISNTTVNKIITNKLFDNLRLRKIFDQEKILIVGSIDENLESILMGPRKQISKILTAKDAIRSLLTSLSPKDRPDLVLTTSPLSLKRLTFLKFLPSKVKVLLTDNKLNFLKNGAQDISFFK